MTIQYVILEYGPFRSQLESLPKNVQVQMSKDILKLKRLTHLIKNIVSLWIGTLKEYGVFM